MNRRGFSVLEALIAVAVLGIGLSALLGLRQTILRQMHAAATLETADTDIRNAMALIAEVNPMIEPAGTREISPRRIVRWRSERLTAMRRSKAYPAGDGSHDVALFRLHVTVVAQDDATVEYEVERLGWREADLTRPR